MPSHAVPPVQSVTSVPVSLAQEQSGRARRYLVMMAIRTACFIAAVVAEGWVRWTCVVGAVLLPYVAVVMVNAVRPRPETPTEPMPSTHSQIGR